MNINWYGQSCFRLESKGVSVLIDPFSKDIGLRAPRLNDNIFLVTHEHPDHNNVKDVPAESFMVRGPGEYEKSGVYIEGILSFHDNNQGTERGMNTMYVIRMEDIRICHMGDLGQIQLTNEQIEAIGDVDILFIPVGGKYTIDGAQAADIARILEPKVITPMHYKIPGLNIDLDDSKKFLKEVGIKPEEVDVFKIVKKNLPQDETKLITFKT